MRVGLGLVFVRDGYLEAVEPTHEVDRPAAGCRLRAGVGRGGE